MTTWQHPHSPTDSTDRLDRAQQLVAILNRRAYRHGYALGAFYALGGYVTTVPAAVSIPTDYLGGPAASPDGYSAEANDYAAGYFAGVRTVLDSRDSR